MTILRRILRKPVFSGQPILSGHWEGSRECPLNTGLTVNLWLQTNKLSLNIQKHTLLFLKLKRKKWET